MPDWGRAGGVLSILTTSAGRDGPGEPAKPVSGPAPGGEGRPAKATGPGGDARRPVGAAGLGAVVDPVDRLDVVELGDVALVVSGRLLAWAARSVPVQPAKVIAPSSTAVSVTPRPDSLDRPAGMYSKPRLPGSLWKGANGPAVGNR